MRAKRVSRLAIPAALAAREIILISLTFRNRIFRSVAHDKIANRRRVYQRTCCYTMYGVQDACDA